MIIHHVNAAEKVSTQIHSLNINVLINIKIEDTHEFIRNLSILNDTYRQIFFYLHRFFTHKTQFMFWNLYHWRFWRFLLHSQARKALIRSDHALSGDGDSDVPLIVPLKLEYFPWAFF